MVTTSGRCLHQGGTRDHARKGAEEVSAGAGRVLVSSRLQLQSRRQQRSPRPSLVLLHQGRMTRPRIRSSTLPTQDTIELAGACRQALHRMQQALWEATRSEEWGLALGVPTSSGSSSSSMASKVLMDW